MDVTKLNNRTGHGKVVMVSNYINHHQIPFCDAMNELLSGAFFFIQTEPMEEERIRMGWKDQVSISYLRKYYEEPEECQKLIDEADWVIFGGTEEESYIQHRLAQKKPLIRYSERLYKCGQWKAISPRGLKKKYHDHTRYRKDEVYLLCSGAYVSSDFHIVRAYPGKMLNWGYFPKTYIYDDFDKLMSSKKPGNIVWAARFLDWKHPELPLETAAYLKKQGIPFHLDLIGGGEMEETVQKLYKEYHLEDVVTLQGYKTPDQVRDFMKKSEICLVTSDRNEGWGAVVNEAMNSGCAVVADHLIGAVPSLIRQGENGFIYGDGCKDQLFAYTAKLLTDRETCKKMGYAAYKTVSTTWNERQAALRLLTFAIHKHILSEEDVEMTTQMKKWLGEQDGQMFADGPCAPAPILSERRMKKRYGSTTDQCDRTGL